MPEIKTRFVFDEYKDVRATLTISMPVKEWVALRDNLREGRIHLWPVPQVKSLIEDMVNKAQLQLDDVYVEDSI